VFSPPCIMRGSMLIFGLTGGVGLPTSACFGGVEGGLGVLSAIVQVPLRQRGNSPVLLLEFNPGRFLYLT
jgi:hypothetical protein